MIQISGQCSVNHLAHRLGYPCSRLRSHSVVVLTNLSHPHHSQRENDQHDRIDDIVSLGSFHTVGSFNFPKDVSSLKFFPSPAHPLSNKDSSISSFLQTEAEVFRLFFLLDRCIFLFLLLLLLHLGPRFTDRHDIDSGKHKYDGKTLDRCKTIHAHHNGHQRCDQWLQVVVGTGDRKAAGSSVRSASTGRR